MNVIASGSDTGSVDIGKSTYLLKIRGDCTVELNGQSIVIAAGSGDYQDFPGDYPTFEVTSGTAIWVAFG